MIKETIAAIKSKNSALTNQVYETIFNTNYPLAEQGNADAQYRLGVMYMRKGDYYVRQSDSNAEQYLTSASQNGHPKADYKLGLSFETRSNLRTQNKQTAAQCYSKACDSPHQKTAVKAAERLVGLGGKEDQAKAINVFRTAAKNGHNQAYKHLGDMYYCGLGTEQNSEGALFYYRKFIGNDQATLEISRAHFVMKPGLGDFEVTIKDKNRKASEEELLFETFFPLAGDGDQNAQLQLGLMYLDGHYVTKSIQNAEKYFELACRDNPHHVTMVSAAYSDREHHQQAKSWQNRAVKESII